MGRRRRVASPAWRSRRRPIPRRSSIAVGTPSLSFRHSGVISRDGKSRKISCRSAMFRNGSSGPRAGNPRSAPKGTRWTSNRSDHEPLELLALADASRDPRALRRDIARALLDLARGERSLETQRSPAISPPRSYAVMTIGAAPKRRTPAISPTGSSGSTAPAYVRSTRRSRPRRAMRASRCPTARHRRRRRSPGAWRACRRSTAVSPTTATSRATRSSSPTGRRSPSRQRRPA